jgi:hypothetical protein
MNQTNNTTITGVGDANEAARQVAAAQARFNGDLVCNFAGAMDTAFA